MIYPRHYNTRGIILIDILIALALGVSFVALVTYTSADAQATFETARERSYALDIYEAHKDEFEGMLPYESRSIIIPPTDYFSSTTQIIAGTTTVSATARWYGNDRIQTDITIETEKFGQQGKMGNTPIVFNSVRTYFFASTTYPVSTPLCSVDFASTDVVGSYRFQYPGIESQPKLLVPSIVPITLPINPTLPLTDIEVRNNTAYISSDSTVAADPDVIVADISDAQHATIVSSINTGPGISSIALAGNRVYAAAASTAAQLHIIRFDGLGVPILEKKYSLLPPYATATPSMASSIFYADNIVYLGTDKWDGDEFSVIDVTDPTMPTKKGGIDVDSKVMDIVARIGSPLVDSVYVGTAGERQFIKLDVSDSAHPSITDYFTPTGWERQEGKVVSFFEDILHLGRTSGGFNIKADHELFSWATSTGSSQFMGSLNTFLTSSVDIAGGVYGLIVDRSYIYLASRAVNKEFQILDHSLSTSTSVAFPLPVAPQTMTCDRDRIYILAATAPVIYQISFK